MLFSRILNPDAIQLKCGVSWLWHNIILVHYLITCLIMKGLFCNVCKLMQIVSNSWNRKEKTNNSKSTYKSQQCSQHISSVISLWLTPAQYSHQWMFVSVSVRKWVHMQALHTQAPHRKQFLEASVKSNLKPLFATVFIHIPLLIIVQFQYKKLHVFDVCMCVQTCCICICICGFTASVRKCVGCSLPGQARTLSFICPESCALQTQWLMH